MTYEEILKEVKDGNARDLAEKLFDEDLLKTYKKFWWRCWGDSIGRQRRGISVGESFTENLASAIYRLDQWQNGIPWELTKER